MITDNQQLAILMLSYLTFCALTSRIISWLIKNHPFMQNYVVWKFTSDLTDKLVELFLA